MCSTAAFLGGRIPFRIRICGWPILGEILVRGLNAFVRPAPRMANVHRDRMTPAVCAAYRLPYDSYATRVAILRFIRDVPLTPDAPSYPVLSEIEAGLERFRDHPMLIFWGMQDWCFTECFLEEWITRFPSAIVHRFPDAAHLVIEDAHERILPILTEFLEPNRPGAPG